MEEEFIINQEKLKPQDAKNEVNIKLHINYDDWVLFKFFNIDKMSHIFY